MVVLLTATRTSMGAVGHYHVHRAKTGYQDWADYFFDMQYVGAAIVTPDGHVLVHHLHTNSPADSKRTIFTALLGLPRIYRVPADTLRRFGHLMTGMLLRLASIHFIDTEPFPRPLIKELQFLGIRAILIAEFFVAYSSGNLLLWCT